MVEGSFRTDADAFPYDSLWLAMGYRGSAPEQGVQDLARSLVGRLLPCAEMRFMYQILPAEKLSPRRLRMGDTVFTPDGIICSYLDGIESVCLFVATAGREFDDEVKKLNEEGDVVSSFIADSIGTVLAEMAVSRVESVFSSDKDHSLSYSPGYCNWDIREQRLVFDLFPPHPCGISLSDSCLMTPEKSVSGFLAFGEHLHRQPYHCEICKNKNCYKRRDR